MNKGLGLIFWLVAILPWGAHPAVASEELRTAHVFSDDMVIQRDQPIPVWGAAEPGAQVSVSLGGQTHSAIADAGGQWQIELAPLPAGGPYTLRVVSNGQSERYDDILIGDVFLCSGQSNMEFKVRQALNPERERKSARGLPLRLLTIAKDRAPLPQKDFAKRLQWSLPDPDMVQEFSAVCFFAGRDLAKSEKVPIGLIHSSWGGSQIEAWMDGSRLANYPAFANQVEQVRLYGDKRAGAYANFGKEVEAWWSAKFPQLPQPWAVSTTGWKQAPDGLGSYTEWNQGEFAGRSGLIFYRKKFEASLEQSPVQADLHLGGIDDTDFVWLNGAFVGADMDFGTWRTYSVPPGIIRPGQNEIVVGVLNRWGEGGLLGPANALKLAFRNGSPNIALSGWEYWWAPQVKGRMPPKVPWGSTHGYTTLNNAMIAPLGPIRLKGTAWYQGESNVGQGMLYKDLLHDLASQWRQQFHQEDLPFYIIQLPGFGPLAFEPAGSGWAELREAQRRAALEDPQAALVVTIDAGDRHDIHPPNKQVVASRLHDAIRKLSYQAEVVSGGARPVLASLSDDKRVVTVAFANAGEGLVAVGGFPGPFELCDSSGECFVASADLREDDTLRLSAGAVSDPVKVRYCWADAPVCTLYSRDSYPAAPFELPITKR